MTQRKMEGSKGLTRQIRPLGGGENKERAGEGKRRRKRVEGKRTRRSRLGESKITRRVATVEIQDAPRPLSHRCMTPRM